MRKMYKLVAATAVTTGLILGSVQAADQQTIVVYGATGPIGGSIVNEALDRGHLVIGVSRHPSKFTLENDNFAPAQGDVTDPASVAATIAGVDVVIVSVSGNADDNAPEKSTHAIAASTLVSVLGDLSPAPGSSRLAVQLRCMATRRRCRSVYLSRRKREHQFTACCMAISSPWMSIAAAISTGRSLHRH